MGTPATLYRSFLRTEIVMKMSQYLAKDKLLVQICQSGGTFSDIEVILHPLTKRQTVSCQRIGIRSIPDQPIRQSLSITFRHQQRLKVTKQERNIGMQCSQGWHTGGH